MSKLLMVAVVCCLVLVHITAGHAAIYILIPGIQGESTDKNYSGWVRAESVSWGHGEAPPNSPSKIQFGRVTVVKSGDSNSAALGLFAATGQVMKDVKLEFTASMQDVQVATSRIKLTNARMVSYAASANANQRPTEQLAFVFDSITWISFKISPTGQQSPGSAGCWDVLANKTCTPTF